MKNAVCIIPLRSGSKGIKNKNIQMINYKPLCIYAIHSAYLSKVFDKIILAIDSIKYEKIILKYLKTLNLNLERFIFFKRSKKNSQDQSSSESVITEILDKYSNYKYCCLIQATSPMIVPEDIKNAFKKFVKNKYDSLFSGYMSKKFIWNIDKKKLVSLNYSYKSRPRRQNFNTNIVENGAVYFFSVKGFKKFQNRLFNKIGYFVMPENRSIEIDNKKDLKEVENIFRLIENQIHLPNKITAIISDIDGVLSSGKIYINVNNKKEAYLPFSVIDGQGAMLCKKNKIKLIAISSNEKYKNLTKKRLKKIGFSDVYFGIKNKKKFFGKILKQKKIPKDNVIYLGDDLVDADIMKTNIISFAPKNAEKSIKKIASYILNDYEGGKDFFRKVVEIVLLNNKLKAK